MKTIEEIKHQIAVENGYKDWIAVLLGLTDACMFKRLQELENIVAASHAKQCCDELNLKIEQLETDLTVAKMLIDDGCIKESAKKIISTPNVAEKPLTNQDHF